MEGMTHLSMDLTEKEQAKLEELYSNRSDKKELKNNGFENLPARVRYEMLNGYKGTHSGTSVLYSGNESTLRSWARSDASVIAVSVTAVFTGLMLPAILSGTAAIIALAGGLVFGAILVLLLLHLRRPKRGVMMRTRDLLAVHQGFVSWLEPYRLHSRSFANRRQVSEAIGEAMTTVSDRDDLLRATSGHLTTTEAEALKVLDEVLAERIKAVKTAYSTGHNVDKGVTKVVEVEEVTSQRRELAERIVAETQAQRDLKTLRES